VFEFRSLLLAGEPLLQAIADDERGPDGGLTRISPFQNRRDPVVPKIQQALLRWRPGCLPVFGADGDFGGESAQAVHAFKRDELRVPEEEIIDDVGPLTVQRLDAIAAASEGPTPPPPVDPELRYTDRKSFFTNRALEAAFGGRDLPDWDPAAGFGANRPRILALYDYYRDLYLRAPGRFLWAGLGRMAGGAVVGGMDGFPPPESFLTQTMVRIGRDIFFDLAWLHEAVLADEPEAVELAELHDGFAVYARYEGTTPRYVRSGRVESYAAALRRITADDPSQVAEGNRMLLANEQWSVIQPHYDAISASDEVGMFELTRTLVEPVHPYHRSFIESQPQGDVRFAQDRWNWITMPAGMLEHWAAAGEAERTRLATLPFDALLRRDFGIPGRPDLLPPGSP
jgi:hypothetical protein